MRVGLILAGDLPGDSCTPDDVLWANAALAPAVEVIDAHVEDDAREFRVRTPSQPAVTVTQVLFTAAVPVNAST